MPSDSLSAPQSRARQVVQVLLVLLVLALLLLARFLPVQRPLAWLTLEVQALGFWGPLAFAALFVAFTVFLLPATPIVLAAGAVFGPVLATLTISLASTVSASLSFFLSRHLAHERAARIVSRYPRLGALWRALGRREGWKLVVAVRLSHTMPFGVQSLLFGLSPVRFWPFVAATWVSMLPGTLLYCYLGYVGAQALGAEEAPHGPAGWMVQVGVLAVIALAVLYIIHLARRILREQTGETD